MHFSDCLNYGAISDAHTDAGMIAQCKLYRDLTIKNCANFGDLSNEKGNLGGAIAYLNAMSTNCDITFTNFLNMGNITSKNYTGGLVGYINTTLPNSFVVSHCVNFGTVTGRSGFTGGFFGNDNKNLSIQNSMSAGTVATGTVGAFVGEKKNDATVTFSDTYYVASSAGTDYGTNSLTDLNAAITKYNTDMSATWGKVMLDGTKVVLANSVFVGVQKTNAPANDGTYSIRLVSVINTAKYSKVGYKIQVNGGTEFLEFCTTAYTGINETVNGNVNTYKATDFGGSYVYALNVDDLDPTETYTFTITPVAYGLEVKGNTEAYIGETYTFVYKNGVFGGYIENSEVQS